MQLFARSCNGRLRRAWGCAVDLPFSKNPGTFPPGSPAQVVTIILRDHGDCLVGGRAKQAPVGAWTGELPSQGRSFTLRMRRLLGLCTTRPRIATLSALLGGSASHGVFLGKLGNSNPTVAVTSLFAGKEKDCIYILGSRRRTNCFCRSLVRLATDGRMCFFPSTCQETVGCKRISPTGRVLHARMLDQLRSPSTSFIVIACPSTLTRQIITQRMLGRGALGVDINRGLSGVFISSILSRCNFRRISCMCRPKRCTLHNDVLSIFSFSGRFPCHVSFFNSRIRAVHAFSIRARLDGRGLSDVCVMPRVDGGTVSDGSLLNSLPQGAYVTTESLT